MFARALFMFNKFITSKALVHLNQQICSRLLTQPQRDFQTNFNHKHTNIRILVNTLANPYVHSTKMITNNPLELIRSILLRPSRINIKLPITHH